MGRIKIPYYVVIKGRGYWRPTAKMRALGFQDVRCGPDGPDAWRVAAEWAERWARLRRGEDRPPTAVRVDDADPETAESRIVYPRGSLGEAFARYRRTHQWTTEKKPATRDDWWRGWRRIRPVFGDLPPAAISLEAIDAWRARVKTIAGEREAHRATKIWRALWKVAAAMHYCERTADPSLGLRNKAAPGRSAVWTAGEAARMVKQAWRRGERGLAVLLAIAWDTQLDPVDVRSLTAAALTADGRIVTARAKTESPVVGVLSRRTRRLIGAYLEERGLTLLPSAPLILTTGGGGGPKGGRPRRPVPFTKDYLDSRFAALRQAVFGPAERRQLRDFRRSGAVEAIAGGAEAESLSIAMSNTIGASNALFRTYVPVNTATVREVATARKIGRGRIRKGDPGT